MNIVAMITGQLPLQGAPIDPTIAMITGQLWESIFDDALAKWSPEAGPDAVENTIDRFKILRDRRFLQGREADISPWITGRFEAFQDFVNKKEREHEQKTAIKRTAEDAERIFENEYVTIVSPNTFEASKKYGANTKWCISGHVKTHWNTYAKSGYKFYFILPKNGDGKLAVTVGANGTSLKIYNAEDNTISNQKFKQLLRAYRIPKNIVSAIQTNEPDWDTWLNNYAHKIHEDGSISINGNVFLKNLNLKELPFQFRTVSGNFSCSLNKLTSLKGSPQRVGKSFDCSHNQLTNLEGGPQHVGNDFYCIFNKLTSLEGGPQYVGGEYHCYYNSTRLTQPANLKINGTFVPAVKIPAFFGDT